MSSGRFSVGHPVDVGSGAMYSSHKDIVIGGAFAMIWERTYNTGLLTQQPSPLGPGWTSPFFAKLTRIGKDFHFHAPDGSVEVFNDPKDDVEHGKVIRSLSTFRELKKQAFNLQITQWNIESGRVLHYQFQPARNGQLWPLRSISNPGGPGIEFSWDETGVLKGIRQIVEKRTLAVTYTSSGRISGIVWDPASGKPLPLIRYEYDSSGRLVAAVDAANLADRYEYDAANRIARDIRKDGQVFRFAYDDKGRCIRTSGLDGYDLKVLRYLEAAGITEVTNSHGRKTTYECLPSGQVAKHTDALGGATSYEYDDHGRIISIKDPVGSETRFDFDAEGNRSGTFFPDSSFLKIGFNAEHLPVSIEDSEGHRWKRAYDESLRLKMVVDADDSEWKYAYHPNGLLHFVVNPPGSKAIIQYSPDMSVQEVTDFGGTRSRYVFDPMGRLIERTNPSGDTEFFRYDLSGKLTEYQTPAGAFIAYQRDAGGNTISVKRKNKPELRSKYGTCGRILEKWDASGSSTRYEWGTEPAELRKILHPNGESTEFTYDANGRTLTETGIGGGIIRYSRDGLGRIQEVTSPSGNRTRLIRDARGNLVEKMFSDGSKVEFAYDKWGRLIAASSPDCALKLKRDELGRVVEEEQNGAILKYTFNPAGQLAKLETGIGPAIGFGYDEIGNFRDLACDGKIKIRIQRKPESREIRRYMPGNLVLGHKYLPDSRKLVQSLAKYAGGNPGEVASDPAGPSGSIRILSKRSWDFDEYSALKEKVDADGGETRFQYDEADRILEVADPKGFRQNYRYDRSGNIQWSEAYPLPGMEYVYGQGHVLLRKGTTEYAFDADGRLIRKTTSSEGASREWRYEWDALDQLKRVLNPEGESWTYAYDALGRRVAKTGPEGTTRFIWDRHVLIQEIRDGKPPATWLYSPGTWVPAGKMIGEEFQTLVPDHIGTPLQLVDSEGEVRWSARSDLWGKTEITQGNQEDCPFRFPGQWCDPETGLHYNRFRYYDPDTGRFLSPDPLRHISGIGPYQYGPNPLNWVDPFGLMIVYRGMRTDSEGKPIVYSGPTGDGNNAGYSLGVRPEEKGKMSTIDDPAYLGDYKRPPGFDGADGSPGTMKKGGMFALDTDQLAQHGLIHDPDGDHHVSIKLLPGIPESELPERLAATRDAWEKVDPPEKKGDPEPEEKEGCST